MKALAAHGAAPVLAPLPDAQAADPVAAVGRFVAGFTHRLRSPLSGLRGYGELAEQEEDRARRAYWHQQLQIVMDAFQHAAPIATPGLPVQTHAGVPRTIAAIG